MIETRPLRVGSLFSGIDGLLLGIAQATDVEPVWFCENDPHASKVLAHHWPDILNHGDITTTDWTSVEPVDLICGGFPCQPASTAGLRLGRDDPRWMWPAFANVIEQTQPALVFIENVRGLLSLNNEGNTDDCSDRGRPVGDTATGDVWTGFGEVLADLAGLGFDAEWDLFSSAQIGGAHRRERLFVLAHSNSARLQRARHARDGRTGFANSSSLSANPHSFEREGWTTNNGESGEGQPEGRGHAVRCGLEDRWGKYAGAVARWEHVHGRRAPDPVVNGKQLNPPLPEWMMGLPAGWVTSDDIGLPRTKQLKAIGNTVQPQTSELAFSSLAGRLFR